MRAGAPKIDDLKRLIEEGNWFSRLGTWPGGEGTIALAELAQLDALQEEDYDWLPTSVTEDDPFHDGSVIEPARAAVGHDEFRAISAELHRLTLRHTRGLDTWNARLTIEDHYLANAARGGALYATRHAAAEILAGNPGPWWRIILIYGCGHWPCAFRPEDGEIYV
ncbi:MAG: hypothetical protein ACK47B_27105 [Armatimonadota bacterium]